MVACPEFRPETIGWYEAWLRRVVMRYSGLKWWEVGPLWGVLGWLKAVILDEAGVDARALVRLVLFHLAASVRQVVEVYLRSGRVTGALLALTPP